MTVRDLTPEKFAKVRQIHEEACARLRRAGGRSYDMHAYALELLDLMQLPETAGRPTRVEEFAQILHADLRHGLDPEQIRRVATLLAFSGAATPDEAAGLRLQIIDLGG
jgi:hypothetical protein